MSFYYPFNTIGAASASILTSSITQTAVTASFTASVGNQATMAFYAVTVGTIGPTGSQGAAATGCVGTTQGPSGSQGPTGSRGQANYDCPANYIACPNLTAPSGYSIVCIPYPSPCTGTTIVCPSSYTP